MKKPRLAIGGLLLPEVPGWTFSERDGEVVGRPPRGPGTLRVLSVPQELMPQPVTHDYCMSVMRVVLMTAGEASERRMEESVCGPFGAATFVRPIPRGRWRGEEEVVRAWYCRRPPGMIYGLYFCRKSAAHGPDYEHARAACGYIMSGVLFDRVGWGVAADDPLTQVLLDHFDRVEDGEGGEGGPRVE